MSKVTIVIEDEDDSKIKRMLNADNAYRALWNITNLLRSYDKYGGLDGSKEEAISQLRSEIHDILDSVGVDLEDYS